MNGFFGAYSKVGNNYFLLNGSLFENLGFFDSPSCIENSYFSDIEKLCLYNMGI